MSTTSGVPALSGAGRSLLLRWIVAIIGFPIGGFIGHLIGGPAATVPAALISGLIAGAIIGAGQAVALGLVRPQALALWAGATAIGLGVALAAVTAVIGQIETQTEAIVLGAISGLALGAGQAALADAGTGRQCLVVGRCLRRRLGGRLDRHLRHRRGSCFRLARLRSERGPRLADHHGRRSLEGPL